MKSLMISNDSTPRPAATVLVLRDSTAGPEVFMVRRHQGTGAFRGAHVFPGGRVDGHDAAADVSWCDGVDHAIGQLADLAPGEALAYHVAAARELFEEAGILLARDRSGSIVSLANGDEQERFRRHRLAVHAQQRVLRDVALAEHLRLALDALTRYAHWVTPPVEGRRFDTRFFATRVPPRQTPAHDETETTESSWTTPRAALAAAAGRDILLPPPTWATLRELERFDSVDQILAWAGSREIRRWEPILVQENGARMLVVPEHRTRFVWTDGYWRPESYEG
jgi:8-oxo-dGTP pyrophosphatase MutT (NUDIX family)